VALPYIYTFLINNYSYSGKAVEASAIQTFPKDYKFHGSKRVVYTQIGNAVPAGLAKAIAEEIKKKLI